MKKLAVLSLVVCLALVLAATASAQGGSGSNNAELSGNYAFSFSGMMGSGAGTSSVFAAVGRFTADGAGNLTNGELDTNTVGTGAGSQPFIGTYSIGPDHRGVMTLNFSSGSARLAFAMLANGNAQFIEFDAAGGSGTIGSGTMEKADATAFSTSRITGDYAFGAAGFDNGHNRAALEGRFTSNGTGTLTSAAGDVNAYGTDYQLVFTAASYAVTDTATGRGTMQLAFTFGGTPDTMNFVFYVVNSGKLFVMESDPVSTATPLLNGTVVQQQTPAGGFSNASLNGNMVISLTGFSLCGTFGGIPKTVLGLLTTDGSGALSLTYDENFCSAPNSVTGAAGTYSVASNGRAAITIGGFSLVAYLVSSNQIFLSVSDVNALFGPGEPQTAGAFTNGSLSGPYAGFATNPQTISVTPFSGEFSANGASPTGAMTGTEDIGALSGPSPGVAFNSTYSISSSPTNGRGTMTVSSGTGGNAVIYTISPSKFVAISLSDPNPAVLVFDQGPGAAATVSLSSLTLSPTSVVGGAQNATGTVTLSGAAPAGGAVVALSSSNPSAAQVPSSVTVPAGATSATFTVTTSAVAASTSVTISASFGGATRTAALTVNPATPAPTLSSLTLSPTSVVGGTQNATGTVTLNGAAPAGGAVVALSSSNTSAAQVPSSVTVPAGATSATFTVTTSAVATSTSVTISASFGGATRTAVLTVNPATPAPTLSSLTLSPTSVVGGAQNATGTVTLSGAAPAGGAVVALSSSNTGAAQVPSSVTVPAGATSATFTVTTSAVVASTSVTISASYGGATRTATLTVNPAVVLPLITTQPASQTVVAGQTATFSVKASGTAPLAYQWSKNGTPISGATLSSYTTPPTMTSDNGSQFTVVVSNSAGSATSSAAILTVTPPPATLSTLTLNPTSVVGGTQSSTGTVTLSGAAPAGGAAVTLSSSNTGAARVPSSVTIPAGATSATFTVTTSAVTASTSVTISASYAGATRTATLTVKAPPLPTVASLTLSPSSVVGGLQSSTGTVTLSGPAPAGGAQVSVSSSNGGAAQVPSVVTIPAGATSTSFTVSTSIVLLSTSSNISASYNGSSRSATLSVLL